ncbi:PEP-CTERM sorting domain-containing protein [Rhodoferax sp.]|uniref:PEP-CTERM sorting domain-containing protein n=1 Tax=Rhodoferax sp. TaxID=50421 RepID=UPI0025FC742A|nr:PEP-CTERM sorting domain-containing protein [Rhodoferax sp.]
MIFKKTLLAATVALAGFGANAATYTAPGSAQLAIPATYSWSFNAVAADPAATLDFVLKGFNTVDGFNSYADVFTVKVNNVAIGWGSFNLGGGGSSGWFGTGTAVNSNGSSAAITGNGGTVTFSNVGVKLNAGSNSIAFAYTPAGSDNRGGQSFGDESWKVSTATVTAVPEPETYAMLLAGLGVMGAIARRRKQAA